MNMNKDFLNKLLVIVRSENFFSLINDIYDAKVLIISDKKFKYKNEFVNICDNLSGVITIIHNYSKAVDVNSIKLLTDMLNLIEFYIKLILLWHHIDVTGEEEDILKIRKKIITVLKPLAMIYVQIFNTV